VLLPPIYALLAPIPLTITKQWRVRRNLAHRRVFSLAANGLAYGAASFEFHSGFRPLLAGLPAAPRTAPGCWPPSSPPVSPAGRWPSGWSWARSS
jgi:hypothetical protein